MISLEFPTGLTDVERWRFIGQRLQGLLSEPDSLSGLCNAVSWLYWTVGQLNWAGVYRLEGQQMKLGPFCGKPACTVLSLQQGVCALAARTEQIVAVSDVHSFEGHVACDADSCSELVAPLWKSDGTLWGVLDLDSPVTGRFTEADVEPVKRIIPIFAPLLDRFSL